MKLQKYTSAGAFMTLLSAALLATSCSSEESLTEPDAAGHSISFTAQVPGAGQPTSRAHWEYSDTYTAGKALKFSWDPTIDTEVWVSHFNGTDWEQGQTNNASTNYEKLTGTLSGHKDNGSVTVSFTPTKFGSATDDWGPDHSVCVLYPKGNWSNSNETHNSYMQFSAIQNTQKGTSTDHLKGNMFMYAIATPSDIKSGTEVEMKHMTAVARFLVVNKRGEVVKVKNVSMCEASHRIEDIGQGFYCTAYWNFGYEEKNKMYIKGDDKYSLTVNTKNNEGTDYYSLPADGTLAVYAPCFETETKGKSYTFIITDGDGKEYVSLAMSGDAIKTLNESGNNAVMPGYYYTFELLLDDKLTVDLTVDDMPGWNTEEDIEN